jgi:hypothetical protein
MVTNVEIPLVIKVEKSVDVLMSIRILISLQVLVL